MSPITPFETRWRSSESLIRSSSSFVYVGQWNLFLFLSFQVGLGVATSQRDELDFASFLLHVRFFLVGGDTDGMACKVGGRGICYRFHGGFVTKEYECAPNRHRWGLLILLQPRIVGFTRGAHCVKRWRASECSRSTKPEGNSRRLEQGGLAFEGSRK